MSHESRLPAAAPPSGPESAAATALRAKRMQILAGAKTVFLSAGYGGASMSQIAKAADVSKGTLYNHFDSKAALFTAFFEEESCSKHNAVKAVSRDERLPLPVILTRLAETIMRLMLEETSMALYRIIIAEAAHFPNLADTFWRYGFGRNVHNLSQWFARKTAQGEIRIDDPDLAAEQFIMMCQTRIVQRKRFMLPVADDPQSMERIARLTAESFLKIYAVGETARHQ